MNAAFKLVMVAPPTFKERANPEIEAAKLKAALKVGMKVTLENSMAERLVSATVLELNDATFKVQHSHGTVVSQYKDVSFVTHGKKITLLHAVHGYQMI